MYVMGIYGGIFLAVSQYNKWKPQAAVKFESKEQEAFIKEYVKHVEHESHKPGKPCNEFEFSNFVYYRGNHIFFISKTYFL